MKSKIQTDQIPHVPGCLVNERRLDQIEAYLMGDLDYKPSYDYKTDILQHLTVTESDNATRLQELELKIPAYEGHAEVMACEAADIFEAYNDLNREILALKTEVKDIKTALHILITKLK